MKIKFKNFQAFRDEEIDLSPGVTLITGPTDNGKTAIFRGLLSLLLNDLDAIGYINGDAIKEKGDDAEEVVTIIDSDIPMIEFHRTKAKAWYMIDGKPYRKLKRDNIFDIYPQIGRKFIYSPEDPTRQILNFQTESNLAFPFDRSDTEMFKLFERIFNITDTRSAIDTLKKDEDQVTLKLNQVLGDKSNYETSIRETEKILSEVDITTIRAYIQQYKTILGRQQRITQEIQHIANYAPFLKTLQTLPKLSKLDDNLVVEHITKLEKNLQEVASKWQFIQNFKDVSFTKEESDRTARLQELASKIDKIVYLEGAIVNENEIIQEAEIDMAEAQKELDSFDKCPLCGHDLR